MAKQTFLDIFFSANKSTFYETQRESLVKNGSKLKEYVLQYNLEKQSSPSSSSCAAETARLIEQKSGLSSADKKLLESTVGLYIYKGFPEVAKFMITELGCDINSLKEQMNASTPLFEAVYVNNIEMTAFLLDNKADVNIGTEYQNRDNESPLHRAAREGFTEICELLLARKADPNTKDAKGLTPIQKLFEWGKASPSVIEVLAKQENIKFNEPNSKGLFPIHQAVGLENPENIKVLAKYKADVNRKIENDRGLTPLQLAISLSAANVKKPWLSSDEYSTIQTLICLGADPKVVNSKGLNAFKHTEILEKETKSFIDFLGIDEVQPNQRLWWAKTIFDNLKKYEYRYAEHYADEKSKIIGGCAADHPDNP